MQLASVFLVVKFGNTIFKFGTYSSLSTLTFENYVTVSDWWRSIDSLGILIVLERLDEIE